MIEKVPSPLEYFSYTLNFQSLMAGPLFFYRDYIEFIEGYNVNPKSNRNVTTKTLVKEWCTDVMFIISEQS